MSDSKKLRFGPYAPPHVYVGEYVACEVRGRLRVHSWSDRGPIMWPLGIRDGRSQGRPAMILTGDLTKAIRREAAIAVATHWGTTQKQVREWRRALGVGRMTDGSLEVAVERGRPEIADYAAIGAVALNASPEAKARRAASQSLAMKGRRKR